MLNGEVIGYNAEGLRAYRKVRYCNMLPRNQGRIERSLWLLSLHHVRKRADSIVLSQWMMTYLVTKRYFLID